MAFFESLFGGGEQPAVEPVAAVRTAADLRAELSLAQDSCEPLAAKLAAAQTELSTARERYDAGIQAFALGRLLIEPDRGELQAAVSKADALSRISKDQQRVISRLRTELAEAELTQAIVSGRDRLPLLIQTAEAQLTEFELAVTGVKNIERALYASLFDLHNGLKQPFASEELQREATRARYSIRNRVESVSRETGYYPALNPDFETDGFENLGRKEQESYWERRYLENARAIQKTAAAGVRETGR